MKQLDDGLWVPDKDKFFKMSFETLVTKKALENTTKRGIFLDVGAHVGLWSMRMSKLYEVGFAFEPVAEHFRCLEENLKESGAIDNVIPIHAGASNEKSQKSMRVSASNSGQSTLEYKPRKGAVIETVQLVRLDDVIPNHAVDFIKMDVEGHEVSALEGAFSILEYSSPDIFIEVNEPERKKPFNALTLLAAHGYKIVYGSGSNYFLRKS